LVSVHCARFEQIDRAQHIFKGGGADISSTGEADVSNDLRARERAAGSE
jgi:hypothetical protein